MCGVIGFFPSAKNKIIEEFNLDSKASNYEKLLGMKNTPRSEIMTISGELPALVPRVWWLIPSWIKDPKDAKYPTFNARAETIREKPTYANAWKNSQRCIIPAGYFVEWKPLTNLENRVEKIPYLVKPTTNEFFSIAGLYETWMGKDGIKIESCTIITTEPNDKMREFHDRMPMLLKKEDEEDWLDKNANLEKIFNKIMPSENGAIESYRISTMFNKTSATNMSLELLRPLD